MPKKNVRLKIPTNAAAHINLLGTVQAKQASQLEKDMETEDRARDVSMPVVTQALRDARDTLLVANRENPKALGDFGYVVDDSPQAKAKAKPAP
jgi:hypothetical protein